MDGVVPCKDRRFSAAGCGGLQSGPRRPVAGSGEIFDVQEFEIDRSRQTIYTCYTHPVGGNGMIRRSICLTGSATRNKKRNSSLPGSAVVWATSFTIAALVLFGTTPVLQASDVHVEEIIRNPTVIYQKAFGVDTTPEIWNRVLDNLYLMGRLWGIYRFQPAYQVTRTDSGIHVVDPTGIVGDVRQVGRSDLSRSFYGRGRFNHWAVPSFFTVDGVIMFDCTAGRNGLLGVVKVFMQGNNWISKVAVKLFSGTLIRHIDNRFTNNMDNMKKIIQDIVEEPDKVRNGLAGPLRDDFNKAFPVTEIKPAEE